MPPFLKRGVFPLIILTISLGRLAMPPSQAPWRAMAMACLDGKLLFQSFQDGVAMGSQVPWDVQRA